MEWLLLLLLVPAVVVPIVLLFGFTGCAALLEVDDVTYAPDPTWDAPTNLLATDIGETSITIAWQHKAAASVEFIISREDPNGRVDEYAKVGKGLSTSFRDGAPGAVIPGVVYTYTVKASNPQSGVRSAATNPLSVRSLKWETVYDLPVNTTDPSNRAGSCIAQRLDTLAPIDQGVSIRQVRLTLRGLAGTTNTLLSNVTISHATSTGSADLYDSDPPIVSFGPTVLPSSGAQVVLAPRDFAMDPTKALIMAFDVSPSNTTSLRGRPGAGQAFARANTTEAATTNRTPGYSALPGAGMYFVERIEVLTA